MFARRPSRLALRLRTAARRLQAVIYIRAGGAPRCRSPCEAGSQLTRRSLGTPNRRPTSNDESRTTGCVWRSEASSTCALLVLSYRNRLVPSRIGVGESSEPRMAPHRRSNVQVGVHTRTSKCATTGRTDASRVSSSSHPSFTRSVRHPVRESHFRTERSATASAARCGTENRDCAFLYRWRGPAADSLRNRHGRIQRPS